MEMTGWTTESFASSSGIGRNRATWENKSSFDILAPWEHLSLFKSSFHVNINVEMVFLSTIRRNRVKCENKNSVEYVYFGSMGQLIIMIKVLDKQFKCLTLRSAPH